MKKIFLHNLIFCFVAAACRSIPQTTAVSVEPPLSTEGPAPAVTAPQPTPTPFSVQPTQALAPSKVYGPDLENFSTEINPLTGLPVEDPSSLQLPAVLVSISNSPISARPQAGLSFASQVIELFIGEGTTRFLAAFYGDLPKRIPQNKSKCEVNFETRQEYKTWVGNRVWFDENKNGLQDPWEAGIGGVAMELLKADGVTSIATTCTDSNGFYAFDASKIDQTGYFIKVDTSRPATKPNAGFRNKDSDLIDPNGLIPFFFYGISDENIDIGFTEHAGELPIADSDIAPDRTYVGPIRSGRLTYDDFNRMFPSSCLVFASAGEGILERLKACEIIYGERADTPNTSLLDIDHLKELAEGNKVSNIPINYSGNLFSQQVPDNGRPASNLLVSFHQFAQSQWHYDMVSGKYARFTDNIDASGIFHSDIDRLTGRQITFENVIVVLGDYNVFRHGQYDVDLCCGLEGYAFLLRDGNIYKIRWSTNNGEWEKTTGLLRPIKFLGEDKQPFPLKPGRTFIALMTKNTMISEKTPGAWQAIFAMPDDFAPIE
jgi:hypothetical protein